MRRQLILLAASILIVGFAAWFSRRSTAIEPPCPSGVPCEEPAVVWPIVLPILGGLIATGGVVAVVLRPQGSQPAFVPDARALRVAIGLALTAAFLLALSLDISVFLGYSMFGATVAAFLLGGAGLRPRGSRSRGLILGVAAYLIAGVVSTLILERGFVGDLDVIAWLVHMLAWPGLWFLFLGGFLGR
jgi:hypothetical protein